MNPENEFCKGPVQRNRCWWKHLVSFIQFTCLICFLPLNMSLEVLSESVIKI